MVNPSDVAGNAEEETEISDISRTPLGKTTERQCVWAFPNSVMLSGAKTKTDPLWSVGVYANKHGCLSVLLIKWNVWNGRKGSGCECICCMHLMIQ